MVLENQESSSRRENVMHSFMLEEAKKQLLKDLNSQTDQRKISRIEFEFSEDNFPNLSEIFKDVDLGWQKIWFRNFSVLTWKPLVAEFQWGLVHVARIVNWSDYFLIFPDGTHSEALGEIRDMHTNESWDLIVSTHNENGEEKVFSFKNSWDN